jgi:type I restriction enzyme S subunit
LYTLSTSKINAIVLAVPPLDEQFRIVSVLDHAEQLCLQRRESINLLDSLMNDVFLEMFGDPATNPYRWDVRELGELASIFSDGPFGSNLKSSHYTETGVRVVRLQNIGVGTFVDDDGAYISPEHFHTLRKHTCLPGDVLVGTLGDPNIRACIQPTSIPVALNKADCVQIRANPELSSAAFLCALLNQPSVEAMANSMMLGQTRVRISMGRLRTLKVPVPPRDLQARFSVRIESIRDLSARHRSHLAELDALFASLQHRAFSGTLALQPSA